MTPLGHVEEIRDIAFSPNMKYIATFSWDGTVKVWKVQTGEILLDIHPGFKNGEEEYQLDMLYSPDGKKIITLTSQGAEIWDAFTGRNIRKLEYAIEEDSYKNENTFFNSKDKLVVGSDLLDLALNKFIKNGGKSFPKRSRPETKIKDSLDWVKTQSLYRGQGMEAQLRDFDDMDVNAYYSADRRMIVTAIAESADIWEAESGRLISRLRSHSAIVWNCNYSNDGGKILTASADGYARLWNVKNGQLVSSIRTGYPAYLPWSAAFSPDGTKMICGPFDEDADEEEDNMIRIWDIGKKQVVFETPGHSARMRNTCFSPDGRRVLIPTNGDSIFILNIENFKFTHRIKAAGPVTASFSADGKKILVVGESMVRVLDAETLKRISAFNPPTGEGLFNATLSPDGKIIIVFVGDESSTVWNAETGERIPPDNAYVKAIEGEDFLTTAVFSPDMKKALISGSELNLWDVNSGKKLLTLKKEDNDLADACFTPDGNRILTAYIDNSCRVWDARNGELLYSFYGIDTTNYLIKSPAGYYMGSLGAAKQLHYVTKDLSTITFEQLDVKYNRPDKVLEAMRVNDPLLVRSYHEAWVKRMQKLNIDTTAFRKEISIPQTDIVNQNKIGRNQQGDQLSLSIRSRDSLFKLEHFNIWVNEVPLYGQRGLDIRKRKSSRFDTTLSIRLSAGLNRIEASVTNQDGTESYHSPIFVNYNPVKPVNDSVYFIGIGINRFSQNSNDLKWCVQDIRDLVKAMRSGYGDKLVIIDTLFDERVTPEIIAGLKKKLSRTGVNDKLIVSYSGHGLLSRKFDYYLSAYHTNFQKPEEGGIPYDMIEDLLDSIPARKKILLLDACHSGELDKEELKRISDASANLAKNNIRAAPGDKGGIVSIPADDSTRLGLQKSFELMQSLFVNVSKGTGSTIIAASGGVQFAQESSELGHGVFTYSLIEAMKRFKTIKVSELNKYIGSRVLELTNGLQKPTTRYELKDFDWELW